jgi:hypothetical protein
MGSIADEEIDEQDRFRPGDLVRVLADGPSLRRSFRQVGLEWNGACAKVTISLVSLTVSAMIF